MKKTVEQVKELEKKLKRKVAHFGQIKHLIEFTNYEIMEAEMNFDEKRIATLKNELKVLRNAETRYYSEIENIKNELLT